MNWAQVAVCAAVFVALAGNEAAAHAEDTSTPAEFPPPSYSGSQYIDSRGCVYIRAGVDGAVTWVPRMTRQRKHICGMTPTASAGATGSGS